MLLDRLPTDLTTAETEKVVAALDLILRNRRIRRRYKRLLGEGRSSVDAWVTLAEEFLLSERQIKRVVYEPDT